MTRRRVVPILLLAGRRVPRGAAARGARPMPPRRTTRVGELRGGRRGAPPTASRRARRSLRRSAARSRSPSAARRRCATRSTALDKDGASLTADLIATAQPHARDGGGASAASRRASTSSTPTPSAFAQSLHERRDVMAEVLMALQRIGRTPPPAILSRPEDALAAIRGSILAGAVLPDIREEAEKLAADLSELTQLTAQIETERDTLRDALRLARRRAGAHRPSGGGQEGAARADARRRLPRSATSRPSLPARRRTCNR